MANEEQLTIFNSEYSRIGTASRKTVHLQGLWHETFHCWFYTFHDNKMYLYFQLRSALKKDFPDKLDISAAGHLMAGETIEDGLREVKEELGLEISYEQLHSLGVFIVQLRQKTFVDNEFANVFIMEKELTKEALQLQEEEVSGIFSIELSLFKRLFYDEIKKVSLKGWLQVDNQRISSTKQYELSDFCVNDRAYYEKLIDRLEKICKNRSATID